MMKKTALMSGVLAGFFVLPAAEAAQIPRCSKYDCRIQYATYNRDDVVVARAKVGNAIMIELENDERYVGDNMGIASGNTGAWLLYVSGNTVFLKPQTATPITNLVMKTNKRSYALDLRIATEKYKPTWILRFEYPDTARSQQRAADRKRREARTLNDLYPDRSHGFRNYDYWAYGSKSLKPAEMWDNGRFTYLRFDDAREMPTVFKVAKDGTESSINSHMEGNTLVVHNTSPRYHLRLGRKVLGVENRSFDSKGKFNGRGTTVQGVVRMKKGG